ncbi:MAG: SprT family zinc-dependent metalloprotease [Pseudomonadota bacterium]
MARTKRLKREYLSSELNIGGRAAPVRLVVNPRAKRLIVKVDQATGCVAVTAPSKRCVPEALEFARSRADWIAEQLQNAPERIPFIPGAEIPFRGKPHIIRLADEKRWAVRRVHGAPPRIVVGGAEEHAPRRVEDWLKRQARATLLERTETYAAAVGRKTTRVSVRDTRTRWGSCSSTGALSFSWRLILAPPFVLDYVAAHECAHLARMDHSPKFWAVVKELVGDAEPAKAWLRLHGPQLHAYGGAK